MTKRELFNKIKTKSNLSTNTCELFYNTMVEVIIEALNEGEIISLHKLGKFMVKTRKSRSIKNPQSTKTIKIPAKHIPVFKPCKSFKECIK